MQYQELGYWLRLMGTPGVGDQTARRLLARFGLPEVIFQQSEAVLRTVVSSAVAHALCSAPSSDSLKQLDTTWHWLHPDLASVAANGIGASKVARTIITLADPRYPPALLATEDPPVMLYCLGALAQHDRPFPAMEQCVAMVGSRSPTAQGAESAHTFAAELYRQGLTVVSGLALGIDAAAHHGALVDALRGAAPPERCTPATIAVVGTGLDRVYPSNHLALARQIAAHGLMVSEYPLGTPPRPPHFPKRNRIIAGLCRATLVVEAALASGSLITARLAVEQGRDVFAIPGSIHSPQSKGCHALIRQGALLVESAGDILDEWFGSAAPMTTRKASTDASAAQQSLLPTSVPAVVAVAASPVAVADLAPNARITLQALGFDPVGFDLLQNRTGLDTPTLQVTLLELELDNRVARLPGGLFQQLSQG